MSLGGVLAEFARCVHLGTEYVRVADAEHAAGAEPQTEQDMFLRRLSLVVPLRRLLHLDSSTKGFVDVAEDHEEGVAIHFEQDAVVSLDHRNEDALGFMDRLQEVNDAELRNPA